MQTKHGPDEGEREAEERSRYSQFSRPMVLRAFPQAMHEQLIGELEALRQQHKGEYDHNLLASMLLEERKGVAAMQLERAVCIESCGRILELTMVAKPHSVLSNIERLTRDMLQTFDGVPVATFRDTMIIEACDKIIETANPQGAAIGRAHRVAELATAVRDAVLRGRKVRVLDKEWCAPMHRKCNTQHWPHERCPACEPKVSPRVAKVPAELEQGVKYHVEFKRHNTSHLLWQFVGTFHSIDGKYLRFGRHPIDVALIPMKDFVRAVPTEKPHCTTRKCT